MADDDTTTGSTDESTQSSTEAGDSAADPQKVIEDLRRRQSGADKAKETAIAERDALQARLDALTNGKPPKEGTGDQPVDAEAIRKQVEKEYEQKLAAVKLDAQYPEARKRFPEVTDATKLAELEGIFSDAPSAPPKPIGNNPPAASNKGKNIEDMSVKELRAALDAEAAGLLGQS